jgi:hypothetical protein
MPTYEEHTLEGPDPGTIEGVVRFEAIVEPEGSGAYIIVPDAMAEALDARGQTSVVGSVNGHAVRGQLTRAPQDGGRRWSMALDGEVREAVGAAAGARVRVELGRDT